MPITAEPNRAGCPFCEDASAPRRVACESPQVQAWWCAACSSTWWSSVVNPQLYLDQLTREAATRSMLREVTTLAEEAPGLSDQQVRARLITLLTALDQHARTWPPTE